jgi:hypothetical protein
MPGTHVPQNRLFWKTDAVHGIFPEFQVLKKIIDGR